MTEEEKKSAPEVVPTPTAAKRKAKPKPKPKPKPKYEKEEPEWKKIQRQRREEREAQEALPKPVFTSEELLVQVQECLGLMVAAQNLGTVREWEVRRRLSGHKDSDIATSLLSRVSAHLAQK